MVAAAASTLNRDRGTALLAANGAGWPLYRTSDGGANWQTLLVLGFVEELRHPLHRDHRHDPEPLVAVGDHFVAGLPPLLGRREASEDFAVAADELKSVATFPPSPSGRTAQRL